MPVSPWKTFQQVVVAEQYVTRRNLTSMLYYNRLKPDHPVWLNIYVQGRHFNFLLGAAIFFFQCNRTIEKLEKQHFICSNLTLFIHNSSHLSFSFFPFYLSFFFLGDDGPPAPSNDAPVSVIVEFEIISSIVIAYSNSYVGG